MNLSTPFEIEYNGGAAQVLPRKVGPDYVYIIDFPTRRPPVMLTKATKQDGKSFWTTIPEEKDIKMQEVVLAEADRLGKLITAHYQNRMP